MVRCKRPPSTQKHQLDTPTIIDKKGIHGHPFPSIGCNGSLDKVIRIQRTMVGKWRRRPAYRIVVVISLAAVHQIPGGLVMFADVWLVSQPGCLKSQSGP